MDGTGLGIIELLVASGLSDSKSAARRVVGEGGAYVNNAQSHGSGRGDFPDPSCCTAKYLLLRRGKKNLATVQVSGS